MIRIQPRVTASLLRGGKPAVLAALQQAIQLEHATIPAYLYALYSLEMGERGSPGPNASIAQLIHSVVIEEMLHMTLAANVLNALGGSPVIDRPDFIPTYPGPLPGSVASGLNVGLAPFSRQLVKDVFMVIEEPEDPLEFRIAKLTAEAAPSLTIGQFYTQIKEEIAALGDNAFTGEPERQMEGPFKDTVVVHDVKTAHEALGIIIDQGEGTSTTPVDLDGRFAHYYRFAEIFHGRRLGRNPNVGPDAPPDERFIYGGAPLPFDENAVYKAPTNPKRESYPPASATRHACDNFNYAYTSLLKTLHAMFNGRPYPKYPEVFNNTLGLMMSLRQQAIDMMAGTNLPEPVGPTFEYQPSNPIE